MPNRIIKESICRSDNLDRLTAEEERFFYRVMVQCDDFGRDDGRPAIIKGSCFPLKQNITPGKVDRMMAALRDAGLIFVYVVDGLPYIQVAKWDKHQQIRAKRSKYPEPNGDTLDLIPDSIIRNQPHSLDSKCPRNPIQSESNPNPNPKWFDAFWTIYPKKRGKGKAEESFAKKVTSQLTYDAVMAGLKKHLGCDDWEKDGGQFIPNPATWLNQRRWEDEPAVVPRDIQKRPGTSRGKDYYLGKEAADED